MSPLTATLAGVAILGLSAPDDTETWAATADGLLRVTADALEAYTLPGTTGAPTAVAAHWPAR